MACVAIVLWLCHDCTTTVTSPAAGHYTGRDEDLPDPLSELRHDVESLTATEHEEHTTRRCAGCGHESFDNFTLFEATE